MSEQKNLSHNLTKTTVTNLLRKEFGRTPDTVYEFAKAYPEGPVAFENLFAVDFVKQIQPKAGRKASWFGRSERSDAFAYFKGMTVAELEDIATFQPKELASYLNTKKIHKDDFTNWIEQLRLAKGMKNISFTGDDLFGEVMKTRYIALSFDAIEVTEANV